jgi:ParB family chromosome partitioning protein
MMLQSEGNNPPSPYEKGNLYQISIADFRPDTDQPRKVIDPEALAELKESIGKHGILQPLLFRTGEQGWLTIVSGERRYLAAKELGLFVLPAIRVEGNHAELALVENLQRQDLTCIEEAEALQRLMDGASYTQEQLAAVIGKARNTITETLSLMKLPVEIRDECRGDRAVGRARLIEISRKKQERAMVTAYGKYREELRKKREGVKPARERLTAGVFLRRFLDQTRERVERAETADFSPEEAAALHESAALLGKALARLTGQPDGPQLT